MSKYTFDPLPLTWWHTIELPDGTKTTGVHDYDTATGDRYLFPDVKGKTVLDIGTFDGYWSARAKKNGAKSVIALDYNKRETAEHIANTFKFKYFAGHNIDFNKPYTEAIPSDVVLFYGVVYHLYNPVQGIINAISLTAPGGIMCIESAVNQAGAMGNNVRFNPATHDGDETNYFMPTIQGLKDTIAVAAKVIDAKIEMIAEATDNGQHRWAAQYRVK
jgi:tRNA (mo5U34)-methyltransferase